MSEKVPWWLWLLGVGGGIYLMSKSKVVTDAGAALLDNANEALLYFALPSQAQPYLDVIKRVAQEQGLDPLLIAAIGMQESRWGQALSPPGPGGTGDAGHGHGIMQIDDRTWGTWLSSNDWTDPYTNVTKGAEILNSNLSYFRGKGLDGEALTQAALAAYNGGPGRVWQAIQAGSSPDSVTTGYSYSSSVLGYFSTYLASAQQALSTNTAPA